MLARSLIGTTKELSKELSKELVFSTGRTDAERTNIALGPAGGHLAMVVRWKTLCYAAFLGQRLGGASSRDILAFFGIRGLASGSNQGLPSRAQTMVSEQ